MNTEQSKIIIQLSEHDAHKVLWLVQKEASDGSIWNEYWERVAGEIREGIEAQAQGRFFQCVGCFEN